MTVSEPAGPSVRSFRYGVLPTGEAVTGFVLDSGSGVSVVAIEYGAAITSIVTPDRLGRSGSVVLGYDSLDEYVRSRHYMGAVVGRVAGRIREGRFTVDGQLFGLATNAGRHHLHGGARGFDRHHWTGQGSVSAGAAEVAFRVRRPDGDQGYPGTLDVETSYRLSAAGELAIDFRAATTRPTPVSLVQHGYFNLTAGTADVLGHQLQVMADRYLPVDHDLLPIGQPVDVGGTPFDFRQPAVIGARINGDHEQLRLAGGLDHAWVIRDGGTSSLVPAARLVDPVSGRTLEVLTTEPALQLYSGNYLDGSHRPRAGLAIEAQQAEYPSTVLRPGEGYRATTVFRFGT